VGTTSLPVLFTNITDNNAAISYQANSTGGSVFARSVSANQVTVTGANTSGGQFNLTTNGNISVDSGASIPTNAPTSSNTGNLSLIQMGGTTLTVDGNLTANGGSIVVQNLNAAGSIVLGDGNTTVAIATNVTGSKTLNGNGLVSIFLGGAPPQLN